MLRSVFREKIKKILAKVDIEIDGDRPWDMQIHNEGVYSQIFLKGSIGLGEAYMKSWWDCEKLDEFFFRVLRGRLQNSVGTLSRFLTDAKARLLNAQKISRAFQVGKRHYDLGNSLYRSMLDQRMIYSCGYWETASTLDEAQEAKLDLICRKLRLESGMRILDIGCGWGGTAKYIAERYNAEIVGFTVSKQQAAYAKELCSGLPVDIRLQDYRKIDEPFDRIVSVGMFEHVGQKNYRTYMRTARKCLKEDGLFLLHTIGGNKSISRTDSWIERYIFPNSKIPSAMQISKAFDGLFVLEDWHNFGYDYDPTLMNWYRNFHNSWEKTGDGYDDRFYRMWKYYLLSCAGSFRARINQLWQIVLSPKGTLGSRRIPTYFAERS